MLQNGIHKKIVKKCVIEIIKVESFQFDYFNKAYLACTLAHYGFLSLKPQGQACIRTLPIA